MGNRNEFTKAQIMEALTVSNGNLTHAARHLNKTYEPESKVTRQNLQTWINAGDDTDAQDMMDAADQGRALRLQNNNNLRLRRDMRRLLDAQIRYDEVISAIEKVVWAAPSLPTPKPMIEFDPAGREITIELLFSDLQVGKLMNDYDSEVAGRRVDEYVDVALARINAYAYQGYRVERIVLAVLGDIIESDKKHDNSGRACDIGTADQMRLGIEWLYGRVIRRLAQVGCPLDIIMITGNHDHDGHGLNMFMPGREHLSWPMYHAVRMLTEAAGIDAEFFIPEGSFHVHQIYGQNVLYEHGVGVATSGAALKKHVGNRIDQMKQYITLFRMGDKHNISRFNNDRHVVNGAFFGDSRNGEEYSGIAGYDGEPAQLMFAHVERKDNWRTSIFDSLAIQLGHIK